MSPQNQKAGCGCVNFLILLAILGIGYGWLASNEYLTPFSLSRQARETLSPIFTAPISAVSDEVIPPFPLPTNVSSGTVINLEGSTRLVSINQELKTAFQQRFLGTTVNSNTQGSEIGIQQLLANKIDIAAVSRPLTLTEKAQGLKQIPITQDKIVVIVHVNNPFRRGLTQTQVREIFTGKITHWSAFKGDNQPIKIINRPPLSETYQVFQEIALKGEKFGNNAQSNSLNQDSTPAILQTLGKEGISYASYAQVKNQLTVRIVPIDGLIPEATDYPYQHSLFYVYREPIQPQVKAFLGYVMSPPGQQVIESAKTKVSQTQTALFPLKKAPIAETPWRKKAIRGIYLSRYQITNNASEETIRERVRYYHSQGINTIIHGVWGNGCTMYKSEVMQKTLGYQSCPNQFQDQWLNWLIDEAHKQGMEVHAYFEKGIKIDQNSPIFNLAIQRKWLVPGLDKTYSGIDHYVLDVEVPEIAQFFTNILVEFVQKYPQIDAVQWDDYLGYHAELPGQVDRTANLSKFVQQMTTAMKKANPSVSFDICHHNPYWAKRYFAADWANWNIDRVFIQAYAESNFKEELKYAQSYAGIAITDQQLHHLKELISNNRINGILIFPLSGQPEKTASEVHKFD